MLTFESFSRDQYEEAVAAIRRCSAETPRVGLVLGSGLGSLAAEIENPCVLPYSEIPHFPRSTVEGHDGQLVLGTLARQPVLVMQGRAHFYEGHSLQRVTFPIRVMKMLGVEVLVLTNAAGGLNAQYRTGDLMLIVDHINLPGMVGVNPLIGPNDESFGSRFPDMTIAYDPELRDIARGIAQREGIPLHEGVYIMLTGPTFETPAEIRFLRGIGGDGVGMSTLPEVVVARHCGLRVLAISGITNVTISTPAPGQVVKHEHVLEAGKIITPRMAQLIRGVLQHLPGRFHD